MSSFASPSERNELVQIGAGFWNVRRQFTILAHLVDIQTHMSFVQLANGKFLVVDTVEVNDRLAQEINHLTDNGEKIEAVIGVHPFHTVAFDSFYQRYPNAAYYGTPRHLGRLMQIPWAGSLDQCRVRRKWEPDVELRIPEGLPTALDCKSSLFPRHRCGIHPPPTRIIESFLERFCLSFGLSHIACR